VAHREDPLVSTIQSILVGTDFSESAAVALDHAIAIARRHAARIVVFHALHPPIPPPATPDFVVLPPEFYEGYREAAQTKLAAALDRAKAAGVEARGEMEVGTSVGAILEAIEKNAPDLVVIGTRGLTGFQHLFLGSVAEKVVQHAKPPVLCVHPRDTRDPGRARTVLVPTDFSEDAQRAARTAASLLEGDGGARLVLLHVYQVPVEFSALGSLPTSVALLRSTREAAEREIEKLAADLRAAGFRVETRVLEGYAPSVIAEQATVLAADLIAMGTHGRSGLQHFLLGSVAERVVQHAPCPVLTVRRP
jgi:nucleotide-binding universal stress UspA family protein